MIVSKIDKKIKCDINGCGNLADYNFEYKKGFKAYGLNLCKSCTNDMYVAIGSVIVPKSPINILNIEKRKEKKLNHEK